MKLPKSVETVLSKIPPSLAKRVEGVLEKLPVVGPLVKAEKRKMADALKEQIRKHRPTALATSVLPRNGAPRAQVLEALQTMSAAESPMWKSGRVSGGVYHGDEEHLRFLADVYALYSQANPLHADVWPSVVRFEAELVRMTSRLMGGDPDAVDDAQAVCGVVSSGGTESIMLAMKAYRDRARATRNISFGTIVAPASAHPAFDKAAHTLGMPLVRVPVDADGRANVEQMTAAITDDTVVMVGSAPSFPHGVVDPIEALAGVAVKKGIWFHTDACLGGFILPFASEAGFASPAFDFRVPGVTSMSADTHKFGYAAKGTSVLLYRGRALRRAQYFTSPEWSGGLYVTPGFAGSRPGALIAQAWAALVSMGHDGYVSATRQVLETAATLKAGIARIDGLRIIGDPLWVVAFASDSVDVFQVLDAMTSKGWSLNGLQKPPAVHVCVTLRHAQPGVAEAFLADLRAAVDEARNAPPRSDGMAPVYGLASSLPFKGLVSDLLAAYVDATYEA